MLCSQNKYSHFLTIGMKEKVLRCNLNCQLNLNLSQRQNIPYHFIGPLGYVLTISFSIILVPFWWSEPSEKAEESKKREHFAS